jgi:acetyl esterase/lipase
VRAQSAALFPGESMRVAAGYPMLTHAVRGFAKRALVVLVPGGGHLGRIFYGHPGARPTDFVAHWLAALGCSIAAISYPLDHPLFARTFPEMSVSDWGKATAEVAASIAAEFELPSKVILAAWSMGGKLVHTFTHNVRRLGLEVEGFISLAASAPIVGMAQSRAPLTLTANGMRELHGSAHDGRSIDSVLWGRGLSEQSAAVGRIIIPDELYHSLYRGDHPLGLRAESERVQSGEIVNAAELAREDARMFDFENFPLSACITPRSQDDHRHALTDASVWAFLTHQAIYHQLKSNLPLTDEAWARALAIIDALPDRLSRSTPGGHFFFVGEPGARQTARLILELSGELDRVRETLCNVRCGS